MKAFNLQSALQNPEQTTELFIHNRNLESFPDEIFSLKNLRVLHLSNNKITSIPQGIINLSALEELDLSNNKIKEFPVILFQISQLKTLIFDNNLLEDIPIEISCLKQLEVFSASNNKLTVIPNTLFLPNLKRLNLSGNSISKVPDSIRNSIKIEMLFLQKNKIDSLADGISKCENLRAIDWSDNRIKNIPTHIGNLKRLEKIDLSKNKLKIIPESLGQCTWLRVLNFQQNKIETLPNSIGHLVWIIHLNVSKNKLQQIPDSVSQLSRLRFLNLEYNQLEKLPTTIFGLEEINNLLLRGNKLRVTPKTILNLQKLEKLSGLNLVFTATERRQILSFLKFSRQQKFDARKRLIFYDLLVSNKLCAMSVLIEALNFPMKPLREKALNQLFEQHNAKKPLTTNSVICFIGKSNFNKKRVREQLKKIGIKVRPSIIKETSHVLLGHFPKSTVFSKAPDPTFISEQDLQTFITENSEKNSTPFDEKSIKNLRQLLKSEQKENIQLAIQILQNAVFPKEIITDLFLIYKTTPFASIKRQLKKILHLNASKKLQQHLSLRLPLSPDLPKEKLEKNIDKYVEGTELEKERIKHFF